MTTTGGRDRKHGVMGTAPTVKLIEEPVDTVITVFNGGTTAVVIDLASGAQLDIEQTVHLSLSDHLAALIAAGHLTLVKES